jgi:hypothetical protein
MFRQSVLNRGLVALGLVSVALPVAAHQVKVSGDVGATLHIEPNDVARAGEPTEIWFALTRQGGQVIPLADCDCQLSIFANPYSDETPALAQPPLVPVTAEGYENIPGSEVVFPQVGAYTLVLSGSPREAEAFQPFELPFEVTVAATARSAPAPAADPAAAEAPANPGSTEVLGVESEALPPAAAPLWQPSVIAASIVLVAGLVWSLRHRRKDDSDPPTKV